MFIRQASIVVISYLFLKKGLHGTHSNDSLDRYSLTLNGITKWGIFIVIDDQKNGRNSAEQCYTGDGIGIVSVHCRFALQSFGKGNGGRTVREGVSNPLLSKPPSTAMT